MLGILVRNRRDKAAAKRFFRKLMKATQSMPRVIVTDKLRSHGTAGQPQRPEHRPEPWAHHAPKPHQTITHQRRDHAAPRTGRDAPRADGARVRRRAGSTRPAGRRREGAGTVRCR
ncbi:DDE-type integrase/transposase/recombinase [Streptomyces werraensis]|uniref:DDE-type integrase/transposase/recombinase n=1 Tax=Streptomyces werraensis TaxID=68284 RepID=UPI0037D7FD2F